MSDEDKPTKLVNHPMEEVLDIESGSTTLPAITRQKQTTEQAEEYDNKDREIEEQFEEIYDLALTSFERQAEDSELVQGQYKARSNEIAGQFLNTALAAAKEKASLKQHKDKQTLASNKATTPGSMTQNNIIVGDRNAILRTIMGTDSTPESPPVVDIDAEFIDEESK